MIQSKTAFEDTLSSEYRQIVANMPVGALLGEKLDDETLQKSLPIFFQYFHLSNSQAYMRARRRISTRTWRLWPIDIKFYICTYLIFNKHGTRSKAPTRIGTRFSSKGLRFVTTPIREVIRFRRCVLPRKLA